MEKIINGAKEHAKKIRIEFKKQTSLAITTAFGLVVALSWKDLVTSIIPSITTPTALTAYPYLPQLFSALIITLFCVLGIVLVNVWANWGINKDK